MGRQWGWGNNGGWSGGGNGRAVCVTVWTLCMCACLWPVSERNTREGGKRDRGEEVCVREGYREREIEREREGGEGRGRDTQREGREGEVETETESVYVWCVCVMYACAVFWKPSSHWIRHVMRQSLRYYGHHRPRRSMDSTRDASSVKTTSRMNH